jgi:hypothetical protein
VSFPQQLSDKLSQIRTRAGIVGVVALAACLVGALGSPDQFFRSYLIGYVLWTSVALGSLALLMIQHLITGQWGWIGRRSFEAAARTLWLLAIGFIPIVLGISRIYVWADPGHAVGDALIEHKSPYLNVEFFLIRAAFYFVIWIGLATLLSRWSRQQDRGDLSVAARFQLGSGLGLVLFALTTSFAAVDWIMSIEPHWFSTIYGLQFIAGVVLTALACMVPVLSLLSNYEPLKETMKPSHFHDFGNLILAFVLLWAYLAFSQYLITWTGNLPEEIPWYLNRTRGGWQWIGLVLVVFHFAVPFAVLLSRTAKRSARMLTRVALAILVLRLVDMIWLVEPAFSSVLTVPWMDVLAPIGIGGLWIASFLWQLRSAPVMPTNDPRFSNVIETQEALEHGAH